MRVLAFACIVLATVVAGCGDDEGEGDADGAGGSGASGSGSGASSGSSTSTGGAMCTAEYTNSCHGENDCWDYYGMTVAGQGECETDMNVWDSTPCDSVGSNGGCRHITGADSCNVRWDFDPMLTPAEVEQNCATLQGTYLPPEG